MLQYYNNANNKNTVNEKVQDKNKNKANDVHSKKEKPVKEFLFPMVFLFLSFRAEVRRPEAEGICFYVMPSVVEAFRTFVPF